MSEILHAVDQRTRMAGKNRMELLTFYLNGQQRFGINVFKVREVIPRPRLVRLPHSHPMVCGIAHIRGMTVPVLDLSSATGGPPIQDQEHASVIVTEYNRSVQGFLVGGVDRIVNLNWQEILPPPSQVASAGYLTAVARVEGAMVQILDVEKVLHEVNVAGGVDPEARFEREVPAAPQPRGSHVLVVDDSSVARKQIRRALEHSGFEVSLASDGEEALALLQRWSTEPDSPLPNTVMVVSDIEMPRMDGYTLTTAIRADERLKGLVIMLHTSLSGVFNEDMVKRVGADEFLPKFLPEELCERVLAHCKDAA